MVFFMFFKLHKWYQIVQSVSYDFMICVNNDISIFQYWFVILSALM